MDCYLFKAAHNRRGFVQKDGDHCFMYLYPTKSYSRKCIEFSFSKHEKHVEKNNEITSEHEKMLKIFEYNGHLGRVLSPPIEKLIPINHSGSFYPRINKGNIEFDDIVFNNPNFIDEIRAFINICDNANTIFNFIEPSRINMNSYGHKPRELLIAACTEVEYLLLQFLKDNKYPVPEKERYTTTHYFCANEIFKLKDYSVQLKFFPGLGFFSPFKDWAKSNPTKSLPWYDAYNSVKHDRGGNFLSASLESAINAIAAIHILLVAQYGQRIFQTPFGSPFESLFYTENVPTFEDEELLCPVISSNHINYIYSWNEKRFYFEDHPIEMVKTETQLKFVIPSEYKEKVMTAAESQGLKVSDFILDAINAKLEE